MSDLISRQAAIDLVRDVCDAVMSGCESWYDPDTGDEVYKDIREVDAILKCNKEIRIALRSMPSAQPERCKGEWIDRNNIQVGWDKLDKSCPADSCKCSNCGEWLVASDEYWVKGNFCPNCGADMRGDFK